MIIKYILLIAQRQQQNKQNFIPKFVYESFLPIILDDFDFLINIAMDSIVIAGILLALMLALISVLIFSIFYLIYFIQLNLFN